MNYSSIKAQEYAKQAMEAHTLPVISRYCGMAPICVRRVIMSK